MTNDVKGAHVQQSAAVHSVDEFVFSVPDLKQALHFYSNFGLDVRLEDGELAVYTAGNDHRWARITHGLKKRLLWLSLGIYERDVEAFESRLAEHGIARIAPPSGAATTGIWINAPDGLPIQLVVAEKCSPSVKSKRVFPPETSTSGRAPTRSSAKPVLPTHLSHILLFSPDVNASVRFYSDILGLRLSDRSGDVIAFMHSVHGSDHHLIAFAKSQGYGLHHSSWDVTSIDDVGIGSQQMARVGFKQGWGLGRHVLGSNYFRYVRDPWGSYAEYSYDIDFIPAGLIWPAADYLPEDALYVWGPDLPADFVVNHELHET